MRKTSFTSFALLIILALSFGMALFSCSQYDYTSPSPGILEIRLKTKNNRTDFIPFGPGNSLVFNMKTLEAIRPGNVRLEVLPDLYAIRRNDDGDDFNCLDTLARDSVYVLGKIYAPPATYTGIDLVAQFVGDTIRVAGAGGTTIKIPRLTPIPLPAALKQLPRSGQSLAIVVNESRLTRVTLMVDLDTSFVRLSEAYLGTPQFFVSSVQNF